MDIHELVRDGGENRERKKTKRGGNKTRIAGGKKRETVHQRKNSTTQWEVQ